MQQPPPQRSSSMMPILFIFGILIALGLGGILWFLYQPPQPQFQPNTTKPSQAQPSQQSINKEQLAHQQAELERKEAELKRKEQEQREAEIKLKEEELRKKEEQLRHAELEAKRQKLAEQERALVAKMQNIEQQPVQVASNSSTSSWYQVDADPVLRVRSSPSTSGTIIGKIPDRGQVKVLKSVGSQKTEGGRTGKWVEIEYKNKRGYVFSGFLVSISTPSQTSTSNSSSSSSSLHKVKAHPHLNIRSAPDVTGKIIGTVKNGRKVQVLSRVSSRLSVSGKSGHWVKIKGNGKVGYVFDAFLEK